MRLGWILAALLLAGCLKGNAPAVYDGHPPQVTTTGTASYHDGCVEVVLCLKDAAITGIAPTCAAAGSYAACVLSVSWSAAGQGMASARILVHVEAGDESQDRSCEVSSSSCSFGDDVRPTVSFPGPGTRTVEAQLTATMEDDSHVQRQSRDIQQTITLTL